MQCYGCDNKNIKQIWKHFSLRRISNAEGPYNTKIVIWDKCTNWKLKIDHWKSCKAVTVDEYASS